MLLPEPRLETLLEQLRLLPRGDRSAILARLSVRERAQLHAHLRGTAPGQENSHYSPDIAERIAQMNGSDSSVPMTAAGRAALIKALALKRAPEQAPGREISLVEALVGRLLPRGWGA